MSILGVLALANVIGVYMTYSFAEKYSPKLKEQFGDFALAGFFGTWSLFAYTLGFLFITNREFPNHIKFIMTGISIIQWSLLVCLFMDLID